MSAKGAACVSGIGKYQGLYFVCWFVFILMSAALGEIEVCTLFVVFFTFISTAFGKVKVCTSFHILGLGVIPTSILDLFFYFTLISSSLLSFVGR